MTKTEYPKSSEILYLKADINYTEFHLVDGRKIVSSYTLKTFLTVHSDFIRISRGMLLNPLYIKSMEKEGSRAFVSLYNGSQMWVSRRRMIVVGNII